MAERRFPAAIAGVAALLAAAWALLGPADTAHACESLTPSIFGVSAGCFDQRIVDAPTGSNLAPDFTQAGGHPYAVSAAINFNALEPGPDADDSMKDMVVDLPPGLIADLAAPARCPASKITDPQSYLLVPDCPPASQIGIASIEFAGATWGNIPIYNLTAGPGRVGRFGTAAFSAPVVLEAQLRSDTSYGLSVRVRNLSQFLNVDGIGMILELWGVPAAASHDAYRSCPREAPPGILEGPSCVAGVSPRPFLRLPTSCGSPPVSKLHIDSWFHPGQFQALSVVNHLQPGLLGDPTDFGAYPLKPPGIDSSLWGPPQGMTGCDLPSFDPSMTVRTNSDAAGAPSGVDVDLGFPQKGFGDEEAVSESDLSSATIAFPPGMSVNTAVANGLGACSEEQVGIDSDDPPACPGSSKLGTVEMRTAALDRVMDGAVFLGERTHNGPGDVELPVFVTAGTDGLQVKLRALIEIDPQSGRATTSFSDVPQVPLTDFKLHFFGGERAPFVNPVTCGIYSFEGSFTPWARPQPTHLGDTMRVISSTGGGPCPATPAERPFDPGLDGGTTNPVAGESGDFVLRLSREDGQQELDSFDVSLPFGLTASLRGVPYCSEANIAAASADHTALAELQSPSCPPDSQVGTFAAALGAGSEPFQLKTGKAYLAGPYEGAPVSLFVVIPALAGPIDLDTMAIRLPLGFDSRDGHMSIDGELPTVQKGVRLNLRRVSFDIDRPGFIVNPTRCKPTSIDGHLAGDSGALASVTAPFQVHDCGALGFAPKLSMKLLGGPSATAHAAHPALRTVVKARRGDANLRRATITLPGSQQLDPSNIGAVCRRGQFDRDACPAGSVYGHAVVKTPLLAEPLRGPIFMRASKRQFPDLVARLDGQVELDLVGKVAFADGRLRLVFDGFPDIPLTKLAFTVDGGRRGILVNNRNLCAAPSVAEAAFNAQNGKAAAPTAELRVGCGA